MSKLVLMSDVDAIYNELRNNRRCIEWLQEKSKRNWFCITVQGYHFEVVHYLDTDTGYQNGLSLFNAFVFEYVYNQNTRNQIRLFSKKLLQAVNRLYRQVTNTQRQPD